MARTPAGHDSSWIEGFRTCTDNSRSRTVPPSPCASRKPGTRHERLAISPLHIGSLDAYVAAAGVVPFAHQSPNTTMEINLLKRFIIERDINNIGAMTR